MRTQAKPEPAPPRDPIEAVFDDGESDHDELSTALTTVQAPMQMTRTQYQTALTVQRPRDMRDVVKRIEREAELSGEDFFYAWSQGGKLVEGVSIDGSMILLRNFTNAAAESKVTQEGPAHWLIDAAFVDLEMGFTLVRQYRQRKGESHQKKGKDGDADRLVDIAFQIGQSKAQRNVIVRAMPEWLVRRAMKIAKQSAEKEYTENLPRYITNCKAAFEKMGVKPAELEAKLGAEDGSPKPEASWTTGDVRVLQAVHRAILARETDVQKEFRPKAPEPVPAPAPTPPGPPAPAPAPVPAATAATHPTVGEPKK